MTRAQRADDDTSDAPVLHVSVPSEDRTATVTTEGDGERPGPIMQALQRLDEIVAAHNSWLKSWHLDVLADVSGGAHRAPQRPDLEQWILVFRHEALADHPASARAAGRLRAMQEAANEVAGIVRRTGAMPTDAYGRFMTSVVDFMDAVRDLQNETWKRLASVDPLTGLGNRRVMWRRLASEAERHSRNQQPCCVAMIDLDNFKPINDSLGHAAGDAVLTAVASLLALSVRPYDSIFRFGGDEFLICLPNTDARLAWAIVERLRLRVANHAIELRPDVQVRATLSIGIAPLSAGAGVERSLDRADEALYAAKRQGRNRVHVWSDGPA